MNPVIVFDRNCAAGIESEDVRFNSRLPANLVGDPLKRYHIHSFNSFVRRLAVQCVNLYTRRTYVADLFEPEPDGIRVGISDAALNKQGLQEDIFEFFQSRGNFAHIDRSARVIELAEHLLAAGVEFHNFEINCIERLANAFAPDGR